MLFFQKFYSSGPSFVFLPTKDPFKSNVRRCCSETLFYKQFFIRRMWIVSKTLVLIVKTPYILIRRLLFSFFLKCYTKSGRILSMISSSLVLIVLIINFLSNEWKKNEPLFPTPLPAFRMLLKFYFRLSDLTT